MKTCIYRRVRDCLIFKKHKVLISFLNGFRALSKHSKVWSNSRPQKVAAVIIYSLLMASVMPGSLTSHISFQH